jgi:hypothetical protein
MTATELLLRDSLQIETAKTARELEYVIRNIEARHAVEGISDADLAAWENLKAQHAERIYRVVTA